MAFGGYKKNQGYEAATPKQLDYIASLARRAGYAHPSHAIKAVLGRHPVGGMDKRRASIVIDELQQRA